MDPFMTSSTTTTPVPTVKVGQGSVNPQLGSHHRRAHSDINSKISNDNLAPFNSFEIDFIDSPPPLPDIPIDPTVAFLPEELSFLNSPRSHGGHIQSFSMDSNMLDYIADRGGLSGGAVENLGVNDDVPVNPVVHQAQGVSMDRSTNNALIEAKLSVANEVVKKAMPPEKLTKLAVVDAKRLKRILANKKLAARSKEKKARHMMELEKKVQLLEEESAKISVKLSKLEKENLDMKAKKEEILCEIESMEESAKLKEELNETLRDKLRQLKKEYKQKVAYKHHNYRGQ